MKRELYLSICVKRLICQSGRPLPGQHLHTGNKATDECSETGVGENVCLFMKILLKKSYVSKV